MTIADHLIEPLLLFLIPAALLLGAFFLILFIYVTNKGHWEDLDTQSELALKDSYTKNPEAIAHER